MRKEKYNKYNSLFSHCFYRLPKNNIQPSKNYENKSDIKIVKERN